MAPQTTLATLTLVTTMPLKAKAKLLKVWTLRKTRMKMMGRRWTMLAWKLRTLNWSWLRLAYLGRRRLKLSRRTTMIS